MAAKCGSFAEHSNCLTVKLLLYSTNFWPEITGSGKYNGELAEWFASRGHTVDVITAPPHYPQWRVAKAYRRKLWFTERVNGVTIYRAPLLVAKTPGGRARILQEISFGITSLPYWLLVLFRKYDAVFAMCPPLQVGIYPYLYSRLRSVPFMFHVQDLQVDMAVRLNMIRGSRVIRLLSGVERFLLTHSTIVSSISEGMKQHILKKGVPEQRYFMLPNWVDLDFIRPLPTSASLRTSLGYSATDVVVLYSGNMGEKQGLELILATAKQLKERADIHFLLCGDGIVKEKIQSDAIVYGLTSVRFLPLQPYEQLPALLASADLHLIVQKRAASDVVMPSKLTSILAAGGVSIVTADDDTSLATVIRENKLGWVVEPENAIALSQQIIRSIEAADLTSFRLNARNYAEKHLSKTTILQRLELFLYG